MLKDLFKKMNRGQETQNDDLNMDYDGFYSGRSERPVDRNAENAEAPAGSHQAGGYYDAPHAATPNRGYVEPDFQSDNARYYDGPVERPVERPVDRNARQEESFAAPREVYTEPDVTERAATPVFTPAPAPEYLYFTPSTYSDCRNGIARGLADGHVVVVRMKNLESADMCRLLDFMMGAKVALDAEHVILDGIIILVPNGVDFDKDELEAYDEDEYEDDEEYDDEYEDDEEYDDEYEDDEEYDDEYDDMSEDDEEYEDDEDEEIEEIDEDAE